MADQGLPIGFDNTSSVWDYMPQIGAMQVGQQNAIAQDNNAALQRAFQNSQDFEAQKRPIELGNLAAVGDQTRAFARHTNAQSTGLDLNNAFTGATQPGNIAKTNATNAVETGTAQGQLWEHAAAQLEAMPPNIPDYMKAIIVQQRLGLPNHPEITQGLINNMSNLPEMMRGMANKIYAASPASKTEALKERAAQQRTETQGSSSLAVAKESSAGKLAVAQATHNLDLILAKAESTGNFEAQAAAAGKRADLEASLASQAAREGDQAGANEHTDLANYYGKKAEAASSNALKKAAAPAGTNKPGAMNTAKFIGAPEASNPAAVTPTPNPMPMVPNPQRVPASAPNGTPGGPNAQFVAPPGAAMTHLISHPELAAQFDAKYGPGTAAAVLKGK